MSKKAVASLVSGLAMWRWRLGKKVLELVNDTNFATPSLSGRISTLEI